MTTFLAALHYIALAVGFSGLLVRGSEFKRVGRRNAPVDFKRLYFGDNLWGIAALLWIGTGLLRAFAGYEKGTEFYLASHWFWLKMTLFGLLFLLELWPMITLIKWRLAHKSDVSAEDRKIFSRFYSINFIELHLVGILPFVASAMARGGFH